MPDHEDLPQDETLVEALPTHEAPGMKHEDYPQVVSTDLPEVIFNDAPEFVSSDFPEVHHKDDVLPEVVRSRKQISWWKRYWALLSIAAVVVIGATIGGAVGGTQARKNTKHENTPTATSTTDIAGLQTSPYPIPTAVSRVPGRIDVFGKTIHRELFRRAYINGSWENGFKTIRKDIQENTNIAALSRSTGTLDLFFVAGDNATYQKSWNVSDDTWVPLNNAGVILSGNLWSTIEAVWWSDSRIDMFGLDPARRLTHKYWNEAGWNSWLLPSNNGGPSLYLYAPTAVIWGKNRGHVFVVDEKTLEVQETVWTLSSNNVTVYPTIFQSIGGRCTSRPSAVSWPDARIDLVCRGADARVAWTTYNGDKWSDWRVAGNGPEILAEPHIISYAQGQLDVVVKSKDSEVYIGFYTEGSNMGWQWFLMLSEAKGSPRAIQFGETANPRTAAFIFAANDSLLYLPYNRKNSAEAEDFHTTVDDLGLPVNNSL